MIVLCLIGGDDHDPSKTAVKASSAAVLARILVTNTNYLAQLTTQPTLLSLLQQAGFPGDESVLLCLVDIWLDKVSWCSKYEINMFFFSNPSLGLGTILFHHFIKLLVFVCNAGHTMFVMIILNFTKVAFCSFSPIAD